MTRPSAATSAHRPRSAALCGRGTCHGEQGRGDGPSTPTLKDNNDLPIEATDLTKPNRFKSGATPQDLYRVLVTGLAGTPMPSYGDSLEPEQTWDLVYYVLSHSADGRRLAGGASDEPSAAANSHGV